MRVLWVGDACVATGFARCTHAACDELHTRGHHPRVLGINHFGDPHDHPYPVHACFCPPDKGQDTMGTTRLPHLLERYPADVIVLLQDPWNIADYLNNLDLYNASRRQQGCDPIPIPPIVAWMAVDARNHDAAPLNRLSHIVVWTEFARDELLRCGVTVPISVVGLGVDGRFRPQAKLPARKRIGIDLPPDAYLIGVVGRNQPRKRLDLTIQYYAEWLRRYGHGNAYLYLHVAPTGEQGYDITRLVRYFGVGGRVIACTPPAGQGMDDELMPYVYSAMDVYLTTTQGEGWGLPALEAMACGVPVVAPDFGGLASWARDVAYLVPCYAHACITAPLGGRPYTVGAIPTMDDTVDTLQHVFNTGNVHDRRNRGIKLAKSLTWHNAGVQFTDVLEAAVSESAATEEPALAV